MTFQFYIRPFFAVASLIKYLATNITLRYSISKNVVLGSHIISDSCYILYYSEKCFENIYIWVLKMSEAV